MPRLSDTLSRQQRLALAAATCTPAQVARTFALYEGQFYDRAAFDHLAREAQAAYAVSSPTAATSFRERLDRRLAERERQPVAWEGTPWAASAPRAA